MAELDEKTLTRAFVNALDQYHKRGGKGYKNDKRLADYTAERIDDANTNLIERIVNFSGKALVGGAAAAGGALAYNTMDPTPPHPPTKHTGGPYSPDTQAEHDKEYNAKMAKFRKDEEVYKEKKALFEKNHADRLAEFDKTDAKAQAKRIKQLQAGEATGSIPAPKPVGATPAQMIERKEDMYGKDVSKTMPSKSKSWDMAAGGKGGELDPADQYVFDASSLEQISKNYEDAKKKILAMDTGPALDKNGVVPDAYFDQQIQLQQLEIEKEKALAKLQNRTPDISSYQTEIRTLAGFQDRARTRGATYTKGFLADREKGKKAQQEYDKKQAAKKKSTGKPAPAGLLSVKKGTDLGEDVGVVGASGLTKSQEAELKKFAAGDADNQKALQGKYDTTKSYESALRKGNIDLYKKQKLTEAFEAGGLQDPAAEVGQVDMREVKVGADGQLTYKGDALGGAIGKEGSRVKTGGQKWSVQTKSKYDMPVVTRGSGAIDSKAMHDDNAAALAGAVAEQGFIPIDTSPEFLGYREAINKVAGKEVNPGYVKQYNDGIWTFIVRDQVNEASGSVNLASGVEGCHNQLTNGFRTKENVDYGAVMNAASAGDARVTEPGIVPTKFGFDHLKGVYLGDGIAGCVYVVYQLTKNASDKFTALQQEKQGADEGPSKGIPAFDPGALAEPATPDMYKKQGMRKGRVGSPLYKATKADFKGTGLTIKTLGIEAEEGVKNIGASMVTPKAQGGVDSISAERDEINKMRLQNEKTEPPNPWVPPKKIAGKTETEWITGLESAIMSLNKNGIPVGPVKAYFTTTNPVSQQFPKLGPEAGMEMIAPFMEDGTAVLAASVPIRGLRQPGVTNIDGEALAKNLSEAYNEMGKALIQNDLPNVLAVGTNYGDGKSVTFFADLQPEHFTETQQQIDAHRSAGRVGRVWLIYKLSAEASDKIMGDKAVIKGRALVEKEMYAANGVTLWGSKLHSKEGQEKLKAKFGDKMTAKPFQGKGGVQRGAAGVEGQQFATGEQQAAGDDAITRAYMANEEVDGIDVTGAGGLSPAQHEEIDHEIQKLEEQLYDEASAKGVGFDEIPSKLDAKRQQLTTSQRTKSAVTAGDRGQVKRGSTGLEQFKFPEKGGAVTDSLKLQKETLKYPSKMTVEDEGHDKTVGAVNGVKSSIDVLAGAILSTRGQSTPIVMPQPSTPAPPPESIPNAAAEIHGPNMGAGPGND